MRTLICYGSLRKGTSYELANHTKHQLERLGSEAVLFDPTGLPLFDYESYSDPKVVQLFNLAKWADSFVWVSPEYHGGPSGVMKNIIDWIPCRDRAAVATAGKAVGIMSVTGGHQSFNTINAMVTNARWLKMAVVPTHVNWALPHEGMTDKVLQRVADAAQEILNFTS